MTTVISPDAEARAEAIGTRADRARDWLADQLDAPFSFDLYVLQRLWNAHGVEALRALRAGEIDVAAEAERNWL